MIHAIALTLILGLPIVAYLGMLAFMSLLATAYIGFANYKKLPHRPAFRWHPRMVVVSFVLILIHMFFASSIFLGY